MVDWDLVCDRTALLSTGFGNWRKNQPMKPTGFWNWKKKLYSLIWEVRSTNMKILMLTNTLSAKEEMKGNESEWKLSNLFKFSASSVRSSDMLDFSLLEQILCFQTINPLLILIYFLYILASKMLFFQTINPVLILIYFQFNQLHQCPDLQSCLLLPGTQFSNLRQLFQFKDTWAWWSLE